MDNEKDRIQEGALTECKTPEEKDMSISLLLKEAEELVKQDYNEDNKAKIEQLKHNFYYLFNGLKRDGEENDNLLESEKKLKESLAVWAEKRKRFLADEEKRQTDNLKKKNEIISKIESWTQNAESIHEHLNELREMQKTWKTIGDVTPIQKTDLWKRYTKSIETFYDLLKMNIELRDYDFAKNLEIKTDLCERAERLIDEENILTAYQGIQNLQDEWRETGPVAKDLRPKMWTRFKDAVTKVNKRHNDYFAKKKEEEKVINAKKDELCAQLETLVSSINISDAKPNSQKEWKTLSNTIAEISKQWKELRSKDTKGLFARYKTSMDQFFQAKKQFFHGVHQQEQENKRKKQDLIDESKSILLEIKERPDITTPQVWKEKSQRVKELQANWKEIGAVPQKISNAMWHEFHKTTNEFFDLMKTSREKSIQAKQEQRKTWLAKEKRMKEPKEKLQRIESEIKTLENNLLFLRPQKGNDSNDVVDGLKATLEKLKTEKQTLEMEIKKQMDLSDAPGTKHIS